MKRKVSKLRPSPNEESRLIREEHERRRKLRIQQVREQQRHIALQIRQEVERRRQRELEQLGEELRNDWERQQREKLEALQKFYQESLQLLGQGHRSAKENEPDLAAVAQKEKENHTKAEERYREALKELKSQRLKDQEMQTQAINVRKMVLQTEKERAAKVASLPPPPPNPIKQYIESKKPHEVKKSDVRAFASVYYHMSDSTVDRETHTQQPNAHEEAELEARRLQHLQRDENRKREEQLEKARLRGKEALRREQLMQDRERLLVELEHMQQTDLLRRRQQVSQMPPQIFQPLYKRHEMKEDLQREMEFAFEDMYTGERRIKGDLVVQLMPEPLPALSTSSQDQELDITMDEVVTPDTENTKPDAESNVQETSVHVQSVKPKPAPRRALKKLLDRIRSQRSQWADHTSEVPAADSISAVADHAPEQDATIDTGSLTSEEKDKLPPLELLQPSHSPPAFEATEQSTAAEATVPRVLSNRVEDFEEERTKREEELEKEKQQQLILLQELEEQKTKLEQLLLEAQQEREHLKVAVTLQSTVTQPAVPQDPVASAEQVTPAGEDDHTRRIRQYQQQLLEQKRIHQRSVKVARQRLEEYQRALRIRYSMISSSQLPAVFPLSLSHRAQSVTLPTSLQVPMTPAESASIPVKIQTSIEVPTRESDTQVSALHSTGSSFGVGSDLVLNKLKMMSNSLRNQRPDVTAWLTDSIMERVTEHLPHSIRPSSSNTEPTPKKPSTVLHSAKIPVQPSSVHPISQSNTDTAAHMRSGTLLQSFSQMGSLDSRDDLERLRQKLQIGSLSSGEGDVNCQRRAVQEVQRGGPKQREQVVQQPGQQEEQRHRQEAQMEKMRRQKEALQALIQSDAQPLPEAAGEAQLLENTKQTRLKLLASLLKVIEESKGGTLSHLEEPEEEHGFPLQSSTNYDRKDPIVQTDAPAEPTSVLPSGLHASHRVTKPPVTRVRLGTVKVMTEQHELSVIQEVETPVDSSLITGPEGSVVASHIADSGGVWDVQEESEWSAIPDKSLQSCSVSSCGQQMDESPGSTTSSASSNSLAWRKRMLAGAGTSPEPSKPDSVLSVISPLSSDSGRGADVSGPAVTNYPSHTESLPRAPDSDCLSSTTISTGSYITTDPEQNADKSPAVRDGHEATGEGFLSVCSPSFCIKESSEAGPPGLAVHSLFNDSSIQRIIEKYTRELDISLSSAGRTGVRESSQVEVSNSSDQQFLPQATERRAATDASSTGHRPPLSDTAATRRSGQCNSTASSILKPGGDDPEQDSFRPLVAQLADESSCVISDQRESAMVRLVGHPSAHSSVIGQLPGLLPTSLDQCGWDSTLSRMIGPRSQWLSGGQDFYAGQLMDLEQSTTWLNDGQEESQMRPLVEEQDSGNSGERTHVDVCVSTEACVPSYPSSASVRGGNLQMEVQTLKNQTNPIDLEPERTEGFSGLDSFHPLLAEVTQNDLADSSMSYHLPEHDVPSSPADQSASEQSVSSCADKSDTHTDQTVGSEPSPERFRTQESYICSTASQELFLVVSPTMRNDVDLIAQTLSHLSMSDVSMPQLEKKEADRICVLETHGDSVISRDLCAEELKCEHSSNLSNDFPVFDKASEVSSERGILEQSEITLVSLTDTTVPDECGEDEHLEKECEEVQNVPETKGSEFTLLPEEKLLSKNQTHPVTFLEFQWGSSREQEDVYQQKRSVLLQKSSRRVEEMKAKGAVTKVQPEIQDLSAASKPAKPEESPPVTCKAKSTFEPQLKNPKPNTRLPEQHQPEKTGSVKLKKPPQGSECKLQKVDEVKIFTAEQRKRDVSEMHQRTQRLYKQLEEVKHQKAIRSRQEAYAKNRLKAKEFHKKTLQKLRAKQTRQ